MASIRKRPTSRFWFACVTLPDGTRKQFPTKTESKEDALAIAVEAETAFRRKKKPQDLRSALARIADEYSPSEQNGVSAGAWLKSWAAATGKEVGESTAEIYAVATNQAADWLDARGVTDLAAISSTDITELRDHWASLHSAGTTNLKLKIVRMALEFAVSPRKILTENPAKGIANVRQKGAKISRRGFSLSEFAVLLGALEGEWLALVLLDINTGGQRLNDISVITWRQLDLLAETVTFIAKKTDKVVCLPLLAFAKEALEKLPSSDDPDAFVFPTIAGYKKEYRSTVFRNILASVGLATNSKVVERQRKKDRKAAGDAEPATNHRRKVSELSFHSLRHTATSFLKSAGVPDSIARAIVGHESVAVSRVYTHFDLDTMREALAKMATKMAID